MRGGDRREGDAEFAVQLVSEILPVKGVSLVGPFPKEVQRYAIISAGISTKCECTKESQAVISHLRDGAIDDMLQARGLERC
jgi:molybdate transport system substrate-binding protein